MDSTTLATLKLNDLIELSGLEGIIFAVTLVHAKGKYVNLKPQNPKLKGSHLPSFIDESCKLSIKLIPVQATRDA